MVYLFTKLLEVLIDRLGSPECVVAWISGCFDIFLLLNEILTVNAGRVHF